MEISLPKIQLGPSVLSDFCRAIQMEWIVANGLGGYASSTVLGINTQKYHGLLVAAFNPPVDRRVLLTKLDEEVRIENEMYPTGANEFKYGIQPRGYVFLSNFLLDPFPTYRYAIQDFQLQKTIFMPYGKNATIIIYEVFNHHKNKVSIRISPVVNSRHFHAVTDKDKLNWDYIQKSFEQSVVIQPSIPRSTLIILSTDGKYLVGRGEWVEEMFFRVDNSRGESCLDDGYQPGWFDLNVAPQESKRFFVLVTAGRSENEAQNILSSIPKGPKDLDAMYNREVRRLKNLLARFQKRCVDIEIEEWLKWLVLAAECFIVNRESTKAKSVIAGYHWFEDWGRDSLISLPGLTLVTGRFEDAKKLLLTFKHYCRKGILPNRFPDHSGDKPTYNTVDATLWYFNAVLQYLKYTGDFHFVQKEIWNTLKSIVEHHIQGTINGIHLEDDGLITHGPQLTWMDAVINQWPVTPREGKTVEVQALWYNALKIMELLSTRFKQKREAERYSIIAEKAKKSFGEKFWNPKRGYLFDVVYNGQKDPSLRPNQVIAVALDFTMLDKAKEEAVIETVWRKLWGGYGLKTLPEDDPRYIGRYLGDRVHRDKAYHNGTVWAWLLGPFTTAFLKVKGYEEIWRVFAFKNFLQPLFQEEILRAGLGTISEIFDGDPPHEPRGCVSQAWSVAELLRAFVEEILLKRPPCEQQVFVHINPC